MKKTIFTLMIALFAILGQMKALDLPHFSTNTGDGAVWYGILTSTEAGLRPWRVEGGLLNVPLGIKWGSLDPTVDNELFCFVGNNTDGFYIYNKAFLEGTEKEGDVYPEDLKLRKLGTGDWDKGGFSLASVEGKLHKWIFAEHALGTGWGILSQENPSFGWWKSGGSQLEIGPVATWEGAYAAEFVYVSGDIDEPPTPPTPTDEPTPSTGFPIKLSSDTGEGAAWYHILWDCGGNDGFKPWAPNAGTGVPGIAWGGTNAENEKQLYCFIGDLENGVKVYNKAYLTGKPINDDELIENDLALQNLTTPSSEGEPFWAGAKLGFTVSDKQSGAALTNQWFFKEGDGGNREGGPAKKGQYKVYGYGIDLKGDEYQFIWNKTGGSELQILASSNLDWGTVYNTKFIWVSGQGDQGTNPPDAISTPAVKAKPAAYASGNEVFVNAAAKEKVVVYSTNGAIVKQTTDTHFTLNSGFYIVKVGTERVKIVVR
jgi:hypothetical protein